MPETPSDPELKITRSDEYKTIFSNIFRSRLGNGEMTVIFSRVVHEPNLLIQGNIAEEQVEIVMTWSQLKMLALHLSSVVNAIEQEIGEIPIPGAFRDGMNQTTQREVVRNLGLSRVEAPAT